MTKTENTAVNRLIEQAHSRPLDADDALFSSTPPRKSLPRPFPNRIVPEDEPAPLPRHRIPTSTQTHLAAAPAAPRPADLEDSGLLQVDDDDDDDIPMTVAESAVRIADIQPIAARPSALGAVPGIDENTWYEESVGVDRLDLDEAQFGTRFVRRSSRAKSMVWLGVAFAAGLAATAFIAWPGRSSSIDPLKSPAVAAPQVATTTTAVAAPAVVPPAAEPAVVEPAVVEPVVPAAPAVPSKLAVELDSEPSGATVLLVEGGSTVTLGATPFSHELDPSRSYELMFTLAGHKSALVTIDPTKSQRVSVDLASSTATAAPRAEAVAVVEPAVAAEPAVVKAEPKAAPKARVAKAEPKAAPKARVARAEPARPASPPAAGGKGGMLMLGSKPPCDIFIDGKATRLKTPQREIKLAPGTHKITLVNREHKITESFSIDVKAGAPTKVVKDLTKRMK